MSLARMAPPAPVVSAGGMRNLPTAYSAEPVVAANVAPVKKFSSCRRDKEGLSSGKLLSIGLLTTLRKRDFVDTI